MESEKCRPFLGAQTFVCPRPNAKHIPVADTPAHDWACYHPSGLPTASGSAFGRCGPSAAILAPIKLFLFARNSIPGSWRQEPGMKTTQPAAVSLAWGRCRASILCPRTSRRHASARLGVVPTASKTSRIRTHDLWAGLDPGALAVGPAGVSLVGDRWLLEGDQRICFQRVGRAWGLAVGTGPRRR